MLGHPLLERQHCEGQSNFQGTSGSRGSTRSIKRNLVGDENKNHYRA